MLESLSLEEGYSGSGTHTSDGGEPLAGTGLVLVSLRQHDRTGFPSARRTASWI